jgi:hypothetical protein
MNEHNPSGSDACLIGLSRKVWLLLVICAFLIPAAFVERAAAAASQPAREGPSLSETVAFIAQYVALRPPYGGYQASDLSYDFVGTDRGRFCSIFKNSVGKLTSVLDRKGLR